MISSSCRIERSEAEMLLRKISLSAARVTRSLKSAWIFSCRRSSSCGEFVRELVSGWKEGRAWVAVSRQYSAVLRTRQAVWSSWMFGRPSPDRRSCLVQRSQHRQLHNASLEATHFIRAPPSTSSAYTLSHLRYTRVRSSNGCRTERFAHRSSASR